MENIKYYDFQNPVVKHLVQDTIGPLHIFSEVSNSDNIVIVDIHCS